MYLEIEKSWKGTGGKVKMPVSKKRKKKVAVVQQGKKGQNSSMIRYICMNCGAQEEIPLEVVRTFDEMDQSNINEPPQFDCESCGGLMRPERYISVYGKVFEYKKDSD